MLVRVQPSAPHSDYHQNIRESSSIGGASPCQGEGRGFESRLSLKMLFTLSIISFLGYFWTNKRPSKYNFKISLDDKIKALPLSIIPYALQIPFIIFTYFQIQTTQITNSFYLSVIIANVSATIFWYFVPNGVKRQPLTEKSFFSKIINFVYRHDNDTNGFPSAHVYISLLCAYYLSISFTSLNIIWVTIGILISASTIFTKQHYLIDILGGVIFTILSLALTPIFLI